MSGSIVVVGLGPGGPQHLTPAARAAVEGADVILGYRTYLKLIDRLAPGTPREGHGMRQEVERVQRAVERARAGRKVALVSSGDAGIYGMAGLVYDVLRQQKAEEVVVEVVPGMSALNAAAALVGAPLMSDFAVISLSDHLTPLAQILRRVELAAEADFVLCLYNPKGRRVEPFARTCAILKATRAPETPVGIVRAASREGEEVRLSTVGTMAKEAVDMLTLLIVGNSRSYVYRGRMVTPRGYEHKYQLGGSA